MALHRIAAWTALTALAALAALAAAASLVPARAGDDEKKPAGSEKAGKADGKDAAGDRDGKECGDCGKDGCGKCGEGACADCKDGKACAKCADKSAAKEKKPEAAAAPAFKLKDTHGKEHALSDYRGKIVVLEWVNHGCPYVKKHYDSGNMQDLQRKYAEKGVIWLSICSSAEGKQGHMSPKEWNEKSAALKAAPTAVLLDADGTAGRAYGAKVTPQMFVLDKAGAIAYRGAIDDNPSARPADAKTAKNLVAEALDALLAGKEPPVAERAPYG